MRHLRLGLWFSIKPALLGRITDCSWLRFFQLRMLVPKDVHRLEASACSVRAFSLWDSTVLPSSVQDQSESGAETAVVSMADGRKAKSWPERGRGRFIVKECVQSSSCRVLD